MTNLRESRPDSIFVYHNPITLRGGTVFEPINAINPYTVFLFIQKFLIIFIKPEFFFDFIYFFRNVRLENKIQNPVHRLGVLLVAGGEQYSGDYQ